MGIDRLAGVLTGRWRACRGRAIVAYSDDEDLGDEETLIERYEPEVCPYCDGTRTNAKAGPLRVIQSAPPGAVFARPDGTPMSDDEIRETFANEACDVCG